MLSALVALGFHRPDELRAMVRSLADGAFEVVAAEPAGRDRAARRRRRGHVRRRLGGRHRGRLCRVTNAAATRVLAFGEGITLLTGNSRTGYTNVSGVGFAPLTRFFHRREWFEQRVDEATARAAIVILGGSDGYWTDVKVAGLINRHCYASWRSSRRLRTCRLRDPRGDDDAIPQGRKREGYGPGEFWLTSDEAEASFCGLSIEND